MRHGTGSTALITTASAEWVLLSVIYHYVLAQSPSPESAKITISTARRNGQLRLRAEVREHEARPDLTLSPGEQPPEIQPKRKPDQPILASDKFSTWDWERSYALRRDATTKSLFEYMDLVGNRDDVLKLWPPAETTVTTETLKTAKTAVAKPVDVSRLVWAVVLTLDEIEKQTPTGLAGFTQKHLTEMVSTRLRRVSQRTLQKAVAVSSEKKRAPLGNSEPPVGWDELGGFLRVPGAFLRVGGGALRTWCGRARSKIGPCPQSFLQILICPRKSLR